MINVSSLVFGLVAYLPFVKLCKWSARQFEAFDDMEDDQLNKVSNLTVGFSLIVGFLIEYFLI